METDRLRAFRLIVDSGGLTKAAEILGVSHSGLSKSMTALQAELGYPLFRPQGRGLEITEDGRSLYERSIALLDLVEELRNRTTRVSSGFRIGIPEALALASAEALAKEFGSELTIDELDSGEIEARVLDRNLTAGLTFVPFPHAELEHLKIATTNLRSYLLKGSHEGTDPELIPYVIPSVPLRDNPLSIRIRDGWNPKLRRETRYFANTLSVGIRLAQSGVCAIYVPEFLPKVLNCDFAVSLVPLDLSPKRRAAEQTKRDIYLIKRKSDEESRDHKRLGKLIRQLLSSG